MRIAAVESSQPWFSFSFPDFSYAFLSILLEGIPFLLLGTLLSGVIDQFLPSRLMTRWLPRNAYAGACLSGLLGVIFPMCECGIVPVIRRLMGKGLPVSNAVAYMLAAPIVNPIVAVSTYAAFRGQSPLEMTALRLGIGYFIAVLVGLAVHNLSVKWVLKPGVLAEVAHPQALSGGGGGGSLGARWVAALQTSVRDFLDVAVYFILGAAAAGVLGTAVNQSLMLPLAMNDWMATASMMGLAGLLSLCSTSDAFIAATFVAFPPVAKLAFLVFGPMVDLKLIFIYTAVFRKRFVLGLVIGLFILIGLVCLRMQVLWVGQPVAL